MRRCLVAIRIRRDHRHRRWASAASSRRRSSRRDSVYTRQLIRQGRRGQRRWLCKRIAAGGPRGCVTSLASSPACWHSPRWPSRWIPSRVKERLIIFASCGQRLLTSQPTLRCAPACTVSVFQERLRTMTLDLRIGIAETWTIIEKKLIFTVKRWKNLQLNWT